MVGSRGRLKDLPPKTLTSERPCPSGLNLRVAIMAHDQHEPLQKLNDDARTAGRTIIRYQE